MSRTNSTSKTNKTINDEKLTKENQIAIEKIIDDIRTLIRKRRVYDSKVDYLPCHQCKELLEKMHLLHCTNPECSRYFCLYCLNNRYELKPKDIYGLMKRSDWDCYVCKGYCMCRLCRDKSTIHNNTTDLLDQQLKSLKKSRQKIYNNKDNDDDDNDNDNDDQDNSKNREQGKNKTQNTNLVRGRVKKLNKNKSKDEKIKKSNDDTMMAINNTTTTTTNKGKNKIKSPIKSAKKENDKISTKKSKASLRSDFTNKKSKSTGGVCHYCSNIVKDKDSKKCSEKDCGQRFCKNCVLEIFDKNMSFGNSGSWKCYSCKKLCTCEKCMKASSSSSMIIESPVKKQVKLVGLKRKIKEMTARLKEDGEKKYGSDPRKQIKTSDMSNNEQDGKELSIIKTKKDKIIKHPQEEISADLQLKNETTPNISKFFSRSEKLEINTTVNATPNSNSQSGNIVKIITEIKSDEIQLTIFDAENVEQLNLKEK